MVVSGTALRLVRNMVTLFGSSSPSQYSKPNSHLYPNQLIAARNLSAVCCSWKRMSRSCGGWPAELRCDW